MNGLILIWLTLALSSGLALASYLGHIKKWTKVFYVSALSNAMVLALFYTPSMYGTHYYFANIVKMIPLIMWLVYLCQRDPSPDWTYRGLQLVFILQILIGGAHVFADNNLPFYSEFTNLSTLLELTIIIMGGINARHRTANKNTNCTGGPKVCSLWAKRNTQGGT